MANNNVIKTRIKQKIDSLSNWIANDPILLQGEIGIVQGDYPKIKIGNGVSKFSQLPYSNNSITVGTSDSLSTVSDLSIITVTPEEYSEKLNSGISDNQLYIVSSDQLYGFDNPIKYVGDGTEATDAATVGQLSNYIQDLSSSTDKTISTKLNSYLPISGGNITSNLSVTGTLSSKTSAILSVTKATSLSTTYLSVQSLTGLSASGKNLCNIISTELDKRSAVYVGNNQELSLANNLSIRVVSPEDYAGILAGGTVPSNEINIVSADYLYAYGKPINYVGDGVLSNDAVTVNQLSNQEAQLKEYVDNALTSKANTQHNHDSTYLKLTGGNISGNLSTSGNISSNGTSNFFKSLNFGGTALDAGLKTRGICGTGSDGKTKAGLFLNYDGSTLPPSDYLNQNEGRGIYACGGDSNALVIRKIDLCSYLQDYSSITSVENLSNKLSSEISSVKNTIPSILINNEKSNTLQINQLTPEEYSEKLSENNIQNNEVNIISSDYLYAFDKPIKYVADGEEATDAATVNQLSSVSAQIQSNIDSHTHSSQYLALSGGNISGTLSVKQLSVSSITNISVGGSKLSTLISSAYNTADQQLSNSLTTLIDQKSTIYVGANSSLLSIQELSIVKLTPEEYAEKLNAGSIPNNELDVISSDQLYGYDKPIKYVADGEENTDAATVGQLKNILSGITLSSSDTTECVRVLKLILQRFGGSSTI